MGLTSIFNMSSAVLVHPSSLQFFVLGFSSLLQGRKNIFSLKSALYQASKHLMLGILCSDLQPLTSPSIPYCVTVLAVRQQLSLNSCLIFNSTSNMMISQIDLLSFCIEELETFPADVVRPHYSLSLANLRFWV